MIPHDPSRKEWPREQDWQPPLDVDTWGTFGVGRSTFLPCSPCSPTNFALAKCAELHVATDVVTAGRVDGPTPPSKVQQMTPGQSARTHRITLVHREMRLLIPRQALGPKAGQLMTGGQRERAVGGHTRSRYHPLPPTAAQCRPRAPKGKPTDKPCKIPD